VRAPSAQAIWIQLGLVRKALRKQKKKETRAPDRPKKPTRSLTERRVGLKRNPGVVGIGYCESVPDQVPWESVAVYVPLTVFPLSVPWRSESGDLPGRTA